MNRGLLTGVKPSPVLPSYLGGPTPNTMGAFLNVPPIVSLEGAPVVADSASPGGIKLSGQFPQHRASLYKSGSQTITPNSWQQIVMDAAVYDPSKLMLNGVVLLPAAGTWLVSGAYSINALGSVTTNLFAAFFLKNVFYRYMEERTENNTPVLGGSMLVVTPDALGWVGLACYQVQAGNITTQTSSGRCWITVQRLS